MSTFFSDYRRNALTRAILWAITIEEFTLIATMNCHYCGAKPKRIKRKFTDGSGLKGIVISIEKVNGIDRVNSSLGYVASNCVPACKRCNQGKNDLSARKYIEHCRRVANYRK